MLWISLSLIMVGFWLTIWQWIKGRRPARIMVQVDPRQIRHR